MTRLKHLRAFVLKLTGCTLVVDSYPDASRYYPPWQGGYIDVPSNVRDGGPSFENVVHEVCSWIVASADERLSENLGSPWDEQSAVEQGTVLVVLTEQQRAARDRQACWLECILFDLMGESSIPSPFCRHNARNVTPEELDHVEARVQEIGGTDRLLEMWSANGDR